MKPKDGSLYYFVRSTSEVGVSRWTGADDDLMRWKIDNCFNTHEEAQALVKSLRHFYQEYTEPKDFVQAGFLKRQPAPCVLLVQTSTSHLYKL